LKSKTLIINLDDTLAKVSQNRAELPNYDFKVNAETPEGRRDQFFV